MAGQILNTQILNAREAVFLAAPFLLILVPVINGVGGNVGTVLGARITSGLYTGTLSVRLSDRGLRAQVRDALVLYLLSFSLLGIFIYAAAVGLGVTPPFGLEVLLFLMLTTGLMLAGVLILVTVAVALLSFSHGLDPDNFITPIVTTLGDLLGIAFLVLVLGAFL
ncbi:MAG: magnesium transporter [Candidatus Thermoplasmatota archaeon]|nr:magnesium transporter [Candidatus Thermoplasmatota archaeon]